jgi:hypothetical protein
VSVSTRCALCRLCGGAMGGHGARQSAVERPGAPGGPFFPRPPPHHGGRQRTADLAPRAAALRRGLEGTGTRARGALGGGGAAGSVDSPQQVPDTARPDGRHCRVAVGCWGLHQLAAQRV